VQALKANHSIYGLDIEFVVVFFQKYIIFVIIIKAIIHIGKNSI